MIHNLENKIIVFYFKLFHFRQNEEVWVQHNFKSFQKLIRFMSKQFLLFQAIGSKTENNRITLIDVMFKSITLEKMTINDFCITNTHVDCHLKVKLLSS